MTGWALVNLSPVLLFWVRPRWSPIHTLIAALIGWAAITSLWAPVTADALDALWKMGLCFIVFCVGYEANRLDRFYVFAGLALLPSGLAVVWSGFDGQPVTGLFGNPAMLGEAAALVVVALGASERFEVMVLPALMLMLSQARGAILAALITLASFRSATVLILVCAVAICILPDHRDMLSTNSLGERVTIWSDALSQLAFFGHGIGGFAESLNSTLRYRVVEYAHNDLIQILSELGVPGLILTLACCGMIFAAAQRTERLVLTALGIEAMFSFPLHTPATAVIGAVVAGRAAWGWDERIGRVMDRVSAFRGGAGFSRLRSQVQGNAHRSAAGAGE